MSSRISRTVSGSCPCGSSNAQSLISLSSASSFIVEQPIVATKSHDSSTLPRCTRTRRAPRLTWRGNREVRFVGHERVTGASDRSLEQRHYPTAPGSTEGTHYPPRRNKRYHQSTNRTGIRTVSRRWVLLSASDNDDVLAAAEALGEDLSVAQSEATTDEFESLLVECNEAINHPTGLKCSAGSDRHWDQPGRFSSILSDKPVGSSTFGHLYVLLPSHLGVLSVCKLRSATVR